MDNWHRVQGSTSHLVQILPSLGSPGLHLSRLLLGTVSLLRKRYIKKYNCPVLICFLISIMTPWRSGRDTVPASGIADRSGTATDARHLQPRVAQMRDCQVIDNPVVSDVDPQF